VTPVDREVGVTAEIQRLSRETARIRDVSETELSLPRRDIESISGIVHPRRAAEQAGR
jgi:hypothetical protein